MTGVAGVPPLAPMLAQSLEESVRAVLGREPSRLQCRGVAYMVAGFMEAWADDLEEPGDPAARDLVEAAALEYAFNRDGGS